MFQLPGFHVQGMMDFRHEGVQKYLFKGLSRQSDALCAGPLRKAQSQVRYAGVCFKVRMTVLRVTKAKLLKRFTVPEPSNCRQLLPVSQNNDFKVRLRVKVVVEFPAS